MLDWIIKFALRNRLLTVAMAAAIVVWGAKIVMDLPVDVFPDLNRPTVTIMVEGDGLAPEEMETLVMTPVESGMGGLPDVIRVRSSASTGFGIIWVEFDWGTDILVNRQLVNEKLSAIKSTLPEGLNPQIGPISSLMGEIMLVGLSGIDDPAELRSTAEWTVRPRLQAVSGVAQIIPIGGGVKQVHIDVDPNQLRKFNLPFEDIREVAAQIGNNTTGGFVDDIHNEYLVRNIGRPRTLEEIGLTTVTVTEGVPLKLKDIADVRFGVKNRRGDAGISAQPGVILAVQKQPGVNTIELTRRIEAELKVIQKALKPEIKLHSLFRQATFIEMAIHNVVEALRDGSIFVTIVLFLFLLNLRTTSITLTAIPLSLLITFIILKYCGISINTMTLGGLAVAIGELVDDAIVDVENVFRRLRENSQLASPRPSLRVVFEASSEVRNSIVLATIIVVMVFIPLFALGGLEGRFFIPLGIAYVVSILASLFVSLTITPVLCSILLPNSKAASHGEEGWLVRKLKAGDRYLLEHILDKPQLILSSCVVLVVLSLGSTAFFGRCCGLRPVS